MMKTAQITLCRGYLPVGLAGRLVKKHSLQKKNQARSSVPSTGMHQMMSLITTGPQPDTQPFAPKPPQ
jgi:hypothetical protein